MLTVQPRGVLRNGFDLVDASGTTLASFVGSAWRENGQIRIGDQAWEFHKDGSRRFALEGPAGTLAVAERASFWTGRWQVTAGRTYELAKPSWHSRRYELRSGGQVVGELQPRGLFGHRTEVDLPSDLPPPAQVFVIAVVLTLWRREESSATAATPAT